jgi:uncharacterized protein (TIGR03437 family)
VISTDHARRKELTRCGRLVGIVFLIGGAALADRVARPIDTAHAVAIPNHTRTFAPDYTDEGPVAPSMRMEGMTLFLKPSAAQRTDLDQLLIALHDPASLQYRHWLTPEEFGNRFTITPADADKIAAWLASQGFHVNWVGRARSLIVFDGTAGAVEAAFHAGIHHYRSATAVHYANSVNPSVPAALQGIVGSIGGLDDFRPVPVRKDQPQYTTSNGTHNLAPGDLATIYDFAGLGLDGTGQRLVVLGESDILTADIQAYRNMFGLPAQNLQPMLTPGFPDPGQNTNLGEADLDLEVAGAVAPNAAFIYLYSGHAYNAGFYAVDQNLAPVITASFTTGCDAQETQAFMSSFQLMAQQAVAQGITWLYSAGDNGAAGCDTKGAAVASLGLASYFPADVPEIVAVGGTEFNEGNGSYWSSTNSGSGASAMSYIPETVWNDTTSSHIAAGSGGVSAFFPKPPWQTGPGVPNDGQRDVPDVAFAASGVHDGYVTVSNGQMVTNGGTSAATPLFAGMVLLLNQYLVKNGVHSAPGLGNLNTMLYRVAQSNPAVFHDITTGNNLVPCSPDLPNCTTGSMGYTAGPGYDLCTGLGSIDFAKLAAAATVKPAPASLIVVSSNANPVYEQEDSSGNDSWTTTLTLNEENGVGTTITAFTIDGKSFPLATWFPKPNIAALGSAVTTVTYKSASVPLTHTFGFTGVDSTGQTWTRQLSLPYVGFAQPSSAPTITSVGNAFSTAAPIAPNTWVAIKGANLAPTTDVRTWEASDFPASQLPTELDGVSVTVNGVSAFVEYISSTQVNILTPPGALSGSIEVQLTRGGSAATIGVSAQSISPSFFVFDGTNVVATHLNGSIVGPATLYPGLSTPAQPGEEVVIYANGFGATSSPVISGAETQSGTLPVLPVVTIAGTPATVVFAGLVSPGLFQFNVVIPTSAPSASNTLIATYSGALTQSGVVLAVQN